MCCPAGFIGALLRLGDAGGGVTLPAKFFHLTDNQGLLSLSLHISVTMFPLTSNLPFQCLHFPFCEMLLTDYSFLLTL